MRAERERIEAEMRKAAEAPVCHCHERITQLVERIKLMTDVLENVLSGDPEMPTYRDDLARAESALDSARRFLGDK